MVAIPPNPSPTLDAIWASYVSARSDERRDHLGASLIGTKCERALWYAFRWATTRQFEGRMLRLFETGNLAEPRFVADLRAAGVTVYEKDDAGRQFSFRAVDGHFGGSMDGCAIGVHEAPKAWHVLEFKTHSEASFKKLLSVGVEEAKPLHYAQTQTYMHMSGLPPYKAAQRIERALYMAVNKNTDELYLERIRYAADTGKRMLEKANRVIRAQAPGQRISSAPTWWECRICDHRHVCHEGAPAERNCRTCMHSTPVANGEWHCAHHDAIRTPEEQRAGCPAHAYIPELVDGAQVDAGRHGNGVWIKYTMRATGSEWVDGPPAPTESPADATPEVWCEVCLEPQYSSPSGLTCANGHGGANGIEAEEYERRLRASNAPTEPQPAPRCPECGGEWPGEAVACPQCGNFAPF